MAIHKHNWVHDNVSIITGSGRKAPSITMYCSDAANAKEQELRT
jgi:hypothetical protein